MSKTSKNIEARKMSGIAKSSLLAAILAGTLIIGEQITDNIQVPLDNRPDSPLVSLKVRIKCAVSDILKTFDDPEELNTHPSTEEKLENKPEEDINNVPEDKPSPSKKRDALDPYHSDEGQIQYT